MKYAMMICLFASQFAFGASTKAEKKEIKHDVKSAKSQQATNDKLKALDKKEEDCDDKAKKKVEIVPETISLSGNAGCTLE